MDSVHFPRCLRRKVLAHPRVFRSRLWLMGKLLRIIVLREDVFPAAAAAAAVLVLRVRINPDDLDGREKGPA